MSKKIKLNVEDVLEIFESARIDCPQCGKRMNMLDEGHYCFDCKKSVPYPQSPKESMNNDQK